MKSLLLLISMMVSIPLFSSCKKVNSSPVQPEIKIANPLTLVAEDTPNGTADLTVTLSAPSDKIITVDFITADSTAIAGTDYVALPSGKIIFQAGEVSKKVTVTVIANPSKKEDVCFKLVLSNPENALLSKTDIKVKILNVDYANLVWSDEFTEATISTDLWNYELGGGGWGNNELETYTNSINNVHIDTGYLHITAVSPSANTYTSGRITTKGKKEFTHFRVDIRAKMPEGKGIWPALWTLGGNISTVNWPKCGEIDIMEYLGHTPSIVYGTLHWDNNGHVYQGSNYTLAGSKYSSGFHVFSLIWTSNQLKWFVDGQQFYLVTRGEAPAFPWDLPQFFIFNVAVGGNWPGIPDANTTFPQNMIVDYIRLYQ
jgi:beta-glucanase (GH16 family)